MARDTVVLIGFEEQPNLGIGYLAAVLLQDGFRAEVLDVRLERDLLLARIREIDPLAVGFSIIFQYHTPDVARLIRYLRDRGVACFFCAGGHYPSLCYGQALADLPGLDAVVLFEGEETLLEIVRRLAAGRDWRDVHGLAYWKDGEPVATPLRPLIADLDRLPFPYRREPRAFECLTVPGTTILASRGCPRACSFCSIRRFYSIPPGKVRRTRSPENVAQEMQELYLDHGVKIFLFQDDDFTFTGRRSRAWALDFVDCLDRCGLSDEVLWKISCRADEIETDTFTALRRAGLGTVYMGLESGNEAGLHILNKQITVDQNRRAVEILKQVGLDYEFGFMLFDPASTLERVLENVRFLRTICGDGSSPAIFSKMMPYAGTDIADQLRREGRLRGNPVHPDYRFLDPRIDPWLEYLGGVLHPWFFADDSVLAKIRWARFETEVLARFFPQVERIDEHRERLRLLVSWNNEIYFRTLEDSARFFDGSRALDPESLAAIRAAADRQRRWLHEQLDGEIARHSEVVASCAGAGPEHASSKTRTVNAGGNRVP